MNKKIVLVVVLALALALSAVLTACEHVHTFAGDWTKDEANHWHAATCGDTDEVADKASHSFKAVADSDKEQCEICGYLRDAVVNPQPKPHEHTYAAEYSADENGHYFAATCEHTSEKSNFKTHTYIDGICSVCGWWSSATDVLFAQLSQLDVWNYAVTFDKFNISPLVEGMDLTDGELKLNMSSDGSISGFGSFKTTEGTIKAVVQDGNVYVCAEGENGNDSAYYRKSLNELLKNAGLDLDLIVASINENTAEIREYVEQLKEYFASLPPMAGSDLTEIMGALVKADAENSTTELFAYVLNVDLLRELNETLATLTVENYVDTMFGEGFFAELPDTVKTVFGMKVGDFLDMMEDQFGYTVDDVMVMLNQLIKSYYPDDSINTVDDLLTASGVDLKGASAKDLIILLKPFTLESLLQLAQSDSENMITVDDIVAKVTELCAAYGDKTLYYLMTQGENSQMTAEDLKAQVSDIADILEENIVIRLYVDSEGVLQKIKLSIDFPADDGSAELSELRKRLAGINGELVLDLGYELSADYSDVIDTVNENYCEHEYDVYYKYSDEDDPNVTAAVYNKCGKCGHMEFLYYYGGEVVLPPYVTDEN